MSTVVDKALEQSQAVETAPLHDVSAEEAAEIQAASDKASVDVAMIPLGLIEKSDVALRDVDRQSEAYQLLVNSIRQKGVLNSILVREIPSGGVMKYGLIDGLQRFSASLDAGKETIPARVVNMDDAELLDVQIITNANRVITKHAQYAAHLLRILSRNPFMTVAQLAEKICQSKTWVEQRLSLNKLTEPIQAMVDEGKIHLTNAYALSKLPPEEQPTHVDAAIDESPKTFVPRMKARVKEIADAKKTGKDAKPAEFQPTQHLQKVGDVKDEFAALVEGQGDSKIAALLARDKVTDPKAAAGLAIAWVLNFDKDSQQAQREAAAARKKESDEAKERRKKEREDQKRKDAAEAAADITTM